MLISEFACGSQSPSVLFVCFLLFVSCGNLLKKAIKNFSGGVNKQHESIGSIMKHHEVSECFRRCQEASGSLRKAHHLNNKKTNKQIRVALKPQVDSKISTVKKHFQLITSLIKGLKSTVIY